MVGTIHIHHYGVLNIFQLLYIPFNYKCLRYRFSYYTTNKILHFKDFMYNYIVTAIT